MAKSRAMLLAGFMVLAFTLSATRLHPQSKPQAAALSSVLPDVAGIRPGMAAQEAYSVLKSRHPSIKIGVGQLQLQGLGDKPIVVQIAAQVVDASAPETITVWLTTPPGDQVVFAVGRLLEYDPNQPLLRSEVLQNLRQKFGAETASSPGQAYWAFDELGKRPDAARMRQLNCMSRAHGSVPVVAPSGSTFPGGTPVMFGLEAATPCDAFIKVNAQLDGPNGQDETYVHRITVTVRDLALERRSQEAYQAYLANADARKGKEELEKAKQRKAPKF